jgi:uncharacterized protein (TIGR02266 family)
MKHEDTTSNPTVIIDLRTAPRVNLCVDIGFRSETNFYTGYTDDLSTGGLFVATFNLKPIGTSLALVFCLPAGREIETEGIVRWIRDTREYNSGVVTGMGIQFCGLLSEDADAIRAFIALRDPIFYAP